MNSKAVVTQPERACKHPKLDKKLRCKTCGVAVDIREKKNKHGAVRTEGFASKKEAFRFHNLRLQENAGLIADLECQQGFDLIVNGEHICRYIADFTYIRMVPGSVAGKRVIEDVKPTGKRYKITAAYRMFVIKKKLMKACHNIDVIEV